MATLKRCEFCRDFIECKLYDDICENLEFLKNFLDFEDSQEIAKYCKKFIRKIEIRMF